MIKRGTRCVVLDNSGGLIAEVFGIYGGTRKQTAKVGDIVKVAIKSALPNGKLIKKGQVCKALVVCTKYRSKNHDGGFSEFAINGLVLLNEKHELMGTQVKGFVSRTAFDKNTDSNIKQILQNCERVC